VGVETKRQAILETISTFEIKSIGASFRWWYRNKQRYKNRKYNLLIQKTFLIYQIMEGEKEWEIKRRIK
jgi:hypothetical protein